MKAGDLVIFNPLELLYPHNADWGDDYEYTTGELGIILKINWDVDKGKGACFIYTDKGVKITFTNFIKKL